MSEHTDAARLEAARDAMRTAPTPERRVGETREWITMGNQYASWPDPDFEGIAWDDFAFSWHREAIAQRAKVEALTKLLDEATRAIEALRPTFRYHDDRHQRCYELATRLRAALSLPTPAPEAAE